MGTGTGVRAIEFADQFSSAAVLGNDLCPIQPSWVPPNCKFIIDDLESEWLYKSSQKFDFIHGRAACGSMEDWPRLYSQAYKQLKPRGWVEMQEYEGRLRTDDDPELLNAPTIAKW
jgi:trans-aconitate methyltransferase